MEYSILDFGALESNEVNTKYIQAAIDECANSGGGRVVVPAGKFVTGTIRLKSHVELYLERGAILKATQSISEYNEENEFPQNFGSAFEGWDARHLIICVEQEDVAITGGGVIEGIGDICYGGPLKHESNFYWREGYYQNEDMKVLRRGILIMFAECRHVTVKDVKIQNSSSWNLLFYGCDFVKATGLTILNDKKNANSDGIDIDSCSFVTVSDCLIDVGDDCVALRNSAEHLKNNTKPCEHITITNCVFSNSVCAIRVCVGYGSVSYVTISDIVMARSGEGLVFSTGFNNSGALHIHDILVRNVVGNDVGNPLQMFANEAVIERVTVSGLHSNCACGVRLLSGIGSLKDIILKDVTILDSKAEFPMPEILERERMGAIICAEGAKRLSLDNIRVFALDDYFETRKNIINSVNTDFIKKDITLIYKDTASSV